MIAEVQIHPKVEKMLEQMKTWEKPYLIAAKRAQRIIDNLVGGIPPSKAGQLYKIKHAGIENLYKYNLGSGYRLVCIKDKETLRLLFVGTHDNCDTWLGTFSGKSPHKAELPMIIHDVKLSGKKPSQMSEAKEEEVEQDCFITPEISQETLRIVFKGLVGGR